MALSPAIFYKGINASADQWRALKSHIRPLRRLRLYLQADAPEEDDEEEPDELEPDYEQIFHQFNEHLNFHAHEIFSAASNLRVLRLQLSSWQYHNHVEDKYGQLEPVLRDVTSPSLRT
jgi:hypothetical protein